MNGICLSSILNSGPGNPCLPPTCIALTVVRLRLEVVNCGELVDGLFAEEDIDKQLNIPARGDFAA